MCDAPDRTDCRRLCRVPRPVGAGHDAGSGAAPGTANLEIFIVKRGWHIDVGFAVADLAPALSSVETQLPRARYLLFGFGDRRYLTARSQRFDALLAALRPGAALVLLTGLSNTPQEAFDPRQVRTLLLDRAQMMAAQAFIWQTLQQRGGLAVRVQSGPYPGSVYLGAAPRYSALHTCNSWAAQVLRAAGVPVRTVGVVFAWQLWRQIPRLQRHEGSTRRHAHTADDLAVRMRRPGIRQLQGGCEPSWQTTVVPELGGTTTVVCCGARRTAAADAASEHQRGGRDQGCEG